MSVLAFKAIGYGAEQIPDKFFEKIPGGFFTPAEKKKIKEGRDKKAKAKERHQSEERSSKRNSRRNRSPRTDYTDDSAYDDTEYEHERERRKKDRRRRAKSVGRSSSRSLSRGRHNRSSSGFDGGNSDARDMAHTERGDPYFPPPPPSEYTPYNPQDYAATPAQGDYRPSSAGQPYGYPSQSAAAQAYPTQPSNGQHDGYSPTYPSNPPAGQSHSSAAKYTPGPGYTPSPMMNASVPIPTVAANSFYPPYNPADYSANTRSGAYPSPPPFNRQRSNSQPTTVPYPTYISPNADQRLTAYDANNQPPGRRGSTKPRREHRHRARSADTHSSRRNHDPDHHRDNSRMTKVRERFDDTFDRMDVREKGLAATVGGALAGGLAGRQLGRSTLTTLAGVAAGALGGRAILDQKSKSRGDRRSRSRSRSRSRHRRGESPPRGIRARSRSIIDRFRSKSRGPEDRDDRKDRYDRPDHGYDRGRDDEFDYSSSESEGNGSPVKTRRHRKRRDY